ncbi:MAG TPA: hypothetical protein VFT55_16060, partial [Planctomycetota bacterium]|nr:hypothetical protein [Planctomycetota bacterium]
MVAQHWTEAGKSFYRLSPDGRTFNAPAAADYALELRLHKFDALLDAPSVPRGLAADATAGLFIVQYWTPGLQEYRQAIELLGAENLLFLPNAANVYALPPGTRDDVAALPFVRAVVPFHPAYKLEAPLLAAIDANVGDEVRVNVLTMHRGAASKDSVARLVRRLGGVVEDVSNETFLMSVTLPVHRLPALAASHEVQWIDRW